MAKFKMREYEVVGYHQLNFTGNDGKKVNGCNVYLRSVDHPEGLVGETGFCVWIDYQRNATYVPTLRDIVVPKFNEHGKPFDFEVNYVGT